jgi:hypothetical protein
MSEQQLPPHLSRPPTGPLEVLVPAQWPLSEPPRFVGKLISYLVACRSDINTIAFDVQRSFASASDDRLQEYLDALSRDGELGKLIQHSRAAMHPSKGDGALGFLGAAQQEWAYVFLIFEQVEQASSKWEIRRRVVSARREESSVQIPALQQPKPWWKLW